jgi:hypothetical protein
LLAPKGSRVLFDVAGNVYCAGEKNVGRKDLQGQPMTTMLCCLSDGTSAIPAETAMVDHNKLAGIKSEYGVPLPRGKTLDFF